MVVQNCSETGRQVRLHPEFFKVRPWESLDRYFEKASFETHSGGMIYIASGRPDNNLERYIKEEKACLNNYRNCAGDGS